MPKLAENRAVADYLNDRQQLIVMLMKLTSATEDAHPDLGEVLRIRLCEQLVDYLSSGYFRVYGDVLSVQSWPDPRDYARFEATTGAVLAFSDRFAAHGAVRGVRLKPALADLALALETRFELEDDLFRREARRHTPTRGARRVGDWTVSTPQIAFAGP